jgi:hypothetical protein
MMDDQIIEVCIRGSLRPPGPKGRISVHSLMALRDALKVPETATLSVYDPNGEWASLGPFVRTA